MISMVSVEWVKTYICNHAAGKVSLECSIWDYKSLLYDSHFRFNYIWLDILQRKLNMIIICTDPLISYQNEIVEFVFLCVVEYVSEWVTWVTLGEWPRNRMSMVVIRAKTKT